MFFAISHFQACNAKAAIVLLQYEPARFKDAHGGNFGPCGRLLNSFNSPYDGRFKENRFVTSEVTLAAKEPLAALDFPVVRYGEKCSDEEIGW